MMLWGLDTASRCTGITAGTGEAMPACGAWHFDHCGDDLGMLLADFDRQLQGLADRARPDVILYEAPILLPGDKLLTLRKLYSLGAYLELFGRRIGAKVEEGSSKTLKKRLTGNFVAKKPEMVAACRRLGVRLPPGEAAKDAADSFAAWLVALEHHGDRSYLTKWDQLLYSRRGQLT